MGQGFNQSGQKYLRELACDIDGKIDVYAVLEMFQVTCPARQHAIKKLLCAGLRNKGSELADLREARDAVDRGIQMQEVRDSAVTPDASKARDALPGINSQQ